MKRVVTVAVTVGFGIASVILFILYITVGKNYFVKPPLFTKFHIEQPSQLAEQQKLATLSGRLECSEDVPLRTINIKVYVRQGLEAMWWANDDRVECLADIKANQWWIRQGCFTFDEAYDTFTLIAVLVQTDGSKSPEPYVEAPDPNGFREKMLPYVYGENSVCISAAKIVKREAAALVHPPKPDAIVEAELLNLRSGPGTVYDILGVLNQGDTLKVTGRSPAGDWLRVITPDGQEGWVEAQFLKINLPVPEVVVVGAPPRPTPISPTDMPTTPTIAPTSMPSPTNTPTDTPMPTDRPTSTPHPGLALVSPPDKGALFPEEQNVKIVWEWERDLADDEFFQVRIRLKGEQEFNPMGLTKLSYQFVPASEFTQTGTYEWQVAIVSPSEKEKGVSQIWSFEVR